MNSNMMQSNYQSSRNEEAQSQINNSREKIAPTETAGATHDGSPGSVRQQRQIQVNSTIDADIGALKSKLSLHSTATRLSLYFAS